MTDRMFYDRMFYDRMFYEQDILEDLTEDILRFTKNSFDRFRTKFIREDKHKSCLILSTFLRTTRH